MSCGSRAAATAHVSLMQKGCTFLAKHRRRIIGRNGPSGRCNCYRLVELAQIHDRVEFGCHIGRHNNSSDSWRYRLTQLARIHTEIELELRAVDISCRLIYPQVNSGTESFCIINYRVQILLTQDINQLLVVTKKLLQRLLIHGYRDMAQVLAIQ